MLCFCACEEPTRKYQMITDAAAPDAAPRRTFQRHWAKRTSWLCVQGSLSGDESLKPPPAVHGAGFFENRTTAK